MKINEFLKQHALQTVSALIIGGIGACITVLAKDAWQPIVANVLPHVRGEYLVLLVFFLILTNVVTIVALFSGRDENARFRKRLVFLPAPAAWQDRKTRVFYCPNCLSKNCVAPMREWTDKYGLHLGCTHCDNRTLIEKESEPEN